jgi:hypothetical protein
MANNFTLNVGEWQFFIEDLGASMNEQFQKLYNYYFSGIGFEHSRFPSKLTVTLLPMRSSIFYK